MCDNFKGFCCQFQNVISVLACFDLKFKKKLNEKVFLIQKMSKFEIGGWNGMAQREKGC